MKTFIAIESSTGDLYALRAKDTEAAYRDFGKHVLGMGEVEDTGNVDIDLYELPAKLGEPVKLSQQ